MAAKLEVTLDVKGQAKTEAIQDAFERYLGTLRIQVGESIVSVESVSVKATRSTRKKKAPTVDVPIHIGKRKTVRKKKATRRKRA